MQKISNASERAEILARLAGPVRAAECSGMASVLKAAGKIPIRV
jgi:hypothetical protein